MFRTALQLVRTPTTMGHSHFNFSALVASKKVHHCPKVSLIGTSMLFRYRFHSAPSLFMSQSNHTEDKYKVSEGLAAQALLGRIVTAKVHAEKARNADGTPVLGPGNNNLRDQFDINQDSYQRSNSTSSSTEEDLPPGQRIATIVLFSTFFITGLWYFGGPDENDTSLLPVDITTRIKRRFTNWLDSFFGPSYNSLLPDPLPPPYQKEYTLIINLNDTMIHPTWDAQHGWRISKRPDLDYFLGYLFRFYEVVVFTRSQGFSAQPILDRIDTYQSIMYRLYRDATLYKDGEYIKDLSKLNRDLSKVIILDWDENSFSLQPENGIKLERWDGSPNIRSLKDYIPFLEMIVLRGVPDVREVLKLYKGLDIPTTFAERQAEFRKRLAEEMKGDNHTSMNSNGGSSTSGGFGSGLRGLLGATSTRLALQHQHQQHIELQRSSQFHQKQFEEEAQLIKEEVERARKVQELEIQRQIAKMSSEKTTLLRLINDMAVMMFDPQAQIRQQQELQAQLASSMVNSSSTTA